MRNSRSGLPRRPRNRPRRARREITRGRCSNACFTLNNPTDVEKTMFTNYVEEIHPDIKYLVFQEERAESGTIHIQGYVEFSRQLAFNVAKRLLCITGSAYMAKRGGTPQEAKSYCQKAESRVEGGISGEVGTISYTRKDSLVNVVVAIAEERTSAQIQEEFPVQYLMHRRKINVSIIEAKGKRRLEPDKGNVSIYVGPTGSGKTTTAWQEYPDAYKGVWPTGGRWWWPNYKGEKVVIFDEFRENISYQDALALLDIHPMSIEFKGGNTENVSSKVIITTIRDPKEWYKKVRDKSELERRINQNCTIYDFEEGGQYPDFEKNARMNVFEFDEYVDNENGGQNFFV